MDDALSFGTVLLTEHPSDGSAVRHRDEVAETARLAESLGFDSVWVGEHHATDRICLGTSGYSRTSQP